LHRGGTNGLANTPARPKVAADVMSSRCVDGSNSSTVNTSYRHELAKSRGEMQTEWDLELLKQ
jgi:hypothetical protein